MKAYLQKIFEGAWLTSTEAYDALLQLTSGDCNAAQAAGFIAAYNMRPPSLEELRGFHSALLEHCLPINLSAHEAVDIVGTGGDGKNSFNISTLSAIVVAAAGCKVVKHGSYGASSLIGSSNVLAFLGYRFLHDSSALQDQLDRTGICFLHAPLFHPLLKRVAPIRRDIGLRSFFNVMGPLINPAGISNMVLGVNSLEVARIYQYLLQERRKNYMILHSIDGFDEISLTGRFKVITDNDTCLYEPEDLGFAPCNTDDLNAGNTIQDAAGLFVSVLQGKGSQAQNNVVIANSAWSIHCVHPERSIEDCIAAAKEALQSGKALSVFQQLLNQ
jgi:anthranilate phosphoribosyltransferase